MGKHGWEAIHLGVSFLFIAIGLGHIWLNRRAPMAYADTRKERRGARMRLVQTVVLMALSGAAEAILI